MSRRFHWAGLVLVAAAASAAHAWNAPPQGGMQGPQGGPGMPPPPPMQQGPQGGAMRPPQGGVQGPQTGTMQPPQGGMQGPQGGGMQPPQGGMPQGPRPGDAVGALMRAADTDDSHDVSADEWTAFLDGLAVDENGAVSFDDLASKLPAPPQGWPEDTTVRDEHLARAFDLDRDGVVTKDDLQALYDRVTQHAGEEPPRGGPQGPGGCDRPVAHGPAGALMRAADADDSHDVTADEWTAFLDGLVVDENGAVSFDDLASKLPAPREGWPEDTSVRDENFLRAFDIDRDGVVTKADLQAVFDHVDRNDDGEAAPAEQRAPRAPRGHQLRAAKAVARAADADDSHGVTADEWAGFLEGLVVDDSGAVSLDDLASKLPAPRNGWPTDTTRRDAMLVRALDADRDGTVTLDDLQALFDGLDRNQDGALDASDAPRRR